MLPFILIALAVAFLLGLIWLIKAVNDIPGNGGFFDDSDEYPVDKYFDKD